MTENVQKLEISVKDTGALDDLVHGLSDWIDGLEHAGARPLDEALLEHVRDFLDGTPEDAAPEDAAQEDGFVPVDWSQVATRGPDVQVSIRRSEAVEAAEARRAVQDPLEHAPRLIAIAGPAGSGKTSAALMLSNERYKVLSFAWPIKRAAMEILLAAGVPARQAHEHLYGARKGVAIPELQGITARTLMQKLGDFGRDLSSYFWVRMAMRAVDEVLEEGGRVVLDDLRLPHELEAVDNAGGTVWQMAGRAGAVNPREAGHDTEAGLSLIPDAILHNTGSLEALEAAVLEALLD